MKKFEELQITGYEIAGYPDQLNIEYRGQGKWALMNYGYCMNREGVFEYEPMPSARDEEFLKRCRFDSAQEAYEIFLKTGRKS